MLTQIINARILTPQGWLKDGSVLIRLSLVGSEMCIRDRDRRGFPDSN